MKRVTIKDIAKIAGISRGTVDRVINNRGNVDPVLEDKIKKIARDLGFRKNVIASNLASQKTLKISVVVPDPESDLFWNIPVKGIKSALSYLELHGISTEYHLFPISDREVFCLKLENALAALPDAILLAPIYTNETLEYLQIGQNNNIPFITINTELQHPNILSYIGQNSFQTGFLAGRLIQLSSAKKGPIAAINLGHGMHNAMHYSEKINGIEQFFSPHDHSDFPIITAECSEYKDPERLRAFFDDLISSNPDISAFFFTNSRAYRLLQLLSPEEIGRYNFVGYDLIDQNIALLKEGKINFLINQNPFLQGYLAIFSIVNHFVWKQNVPKKQYLPADVIMKENIDYYNEGEIFSATARSYSST